MIDGTQPENNAHVSGIGALAHVIYVDVAVERWRQFTGKAAVIDGSDESSAISPLRNEAVQAHVAC